MICWVAIAFLSFCWPVTHCLNYTPVPSEYNLIGVLVLVRHGDRVQITRELGDAFHENKNLTKFWKAKLPSEKTLRFIAYAANPSVPKDTPFDVLRKRLYTGWDYNHIPYGQLTEHGAQQLLELGRNLNKRYVGNFLSNYGSKASDSLYCRSTNICRTMLSLRSFLKGLLQHNYDNLSWGDIRVPTIFSRMKSQETMYPHADGPCLGMTERRLMLINGNYNNASSMPPFVNQLENKLKRILGLNEPFTWLLWLDMMEIMICYETHNVPLPEGITHEDVKNTIFFVSWVWGALYKDRDLVRFAVGRFIQEMIDDMKAITDTRGVERRRRLQHAGAGSGSGPGSASASGSGSSSEGSGSGSGSGSRGLGPERSGQVGKDEAAQSTNASVAREAPMEGEVTLSLRPPNQHTKMIVYSGHDATIVPILVALGLYSGVWPEYASSLTFEIVTMKSASKRGNSSSPAGGGAGTGPGSDGGLVSGSRRNVRKMVRVVYNNEVVVVSGCVFVWCPFSRFLEPLQLHAMGPAEYKAMCRNVES